MIGWVLIVVGVLLAVAGAAWLFGPLVLVAAGALFVGVGLFADFDPVKEPQRAKRHSAAP